MNSDYSTCAAGIYSATGDCRRNPAVLFDIFLQLIVRFMHLSYKILHGTLEMKWKAIQVSNERSKAKAAQGKVERANTHQFPRL